MTTQRSSPEFNEEAVRQVLGRGYSVAEVGALLEVSTHSLYKWVKAVTPPKDEKLAAELVEAKSEIHRLRAQMRRLEEERDLLKAERHFARETAARTKPNPSSERMCNGTALRTNLERPLWESCTSA